MNHAHTSPLKNSSATESISSPMLFFFFYISSFFLLIVLGFSSQLDFETESLTTANYLGILSIFDVFLIEFSVLLLFGWFLLHRNWFARTILYLLSSSFIIIYSTQLASFYLVNEYISRLALDNINHIELLINPLSISLSVGVVISCVALPFFIEKNQRTQKLQHKTSPAELCFYLIFPIVLLIAIHWMPQSIKAQKEGMIKANNLQHVAPITSLYHTIFQEDTFGEDGEANIQFSQYELNSLKDFHFHYNPNSEYPLIKDTVYSSAPPFTKINGASDSPNVIVFFTEGYSARSMGVYGSKYPDLTPHLDDFASNSMVVDNYYNHTGATYRGLHGQLCSLYPKFGGLGGWQTDYSDLPDTTYRCLPDIINEAHYETIFLDAHLKDASQVDEMVARLGFKNVVTGEDLLDRFLHQATAMRPESLSDKQFYHGLIGYLTEREKKGKADSPFFLGLYNLGTHAFLAMPKDGKKYKKGSNISLNTIHTLDMAFGQFWEYYQQSPYAKNTIIIFTADHCHYPEKPFVQAFQGDDYQPFFVDKIPLIIHDPTRSLPKRYNALNATSINFTPSILHYLQMANERNPFIGRSIFEDERSQEVGLEVNSYGERLYLIAGDKIYEKGKSEQFPIIFQVINKYVKVTKYLEVNDRIWDEKPTDSNSNE